MKKSIILPITLLSIVSFTGCFQKSKELRYTHEAYVHMLLVRSLEPTPYDKIKREVKMSGSTYELNYYFVDGKWINDYGYEAEDLNDISDDVFDLYYLEEEQLDKCYFYATDNSYHIKGKDIEREFVYQFLDPIVCTKYSFDFYYDQYGMSKKKTYELFYPAHGDALEKVKAVETYSYSYR